MTLAACALRYWERRQEVAANNLANVNTTGFEQSRVHFEDLLYQTVQGAPVVAAPDAQTTPAIQIGRGVRLSAVERVHSQGPLEMTSRPLDLAMEGEGFFQVQMPDGAVAYTCDGSFTISGQGTLVTHGGYTVVPGIYLPDDAAGITISRTLSGWVRPEHVSATNLVDPYRVADAQLVYSSKGSLGKPKGGVLGRIVGALWP